MESANGSRCASSKRSASSMRLQNFNRFPCASIKSSARESKNNNIDFISAMDFSITEKSIAVFIRSAVPAAISFCGNKLSFALSAKYSHIFCPVSAVKSVVTVFWISSIFSPSNGRSFGNAFKASRILAPVFTNSVMFKYPLLNCVRI